MAPMSHTVDNSQHLAIRGVIVEFGGGAFAGIKGNRVPVGVVELADDARDGKTGSVGVNANGAVGIEVFKDGGRGEMEFEVVEGGLSGGGPDELLALFEEGSNGGN